MATDHTGLPPLLLLLFINAALDTQRAPRQGGEIVLRCLSALELLATISPESVDLLLTDPPYMTDVPDIAAFAAEWVPPAIATLKRSGRAYICTGSYRQEGDSPH
jgi:hypothetical protein